MSTATAQMTEAPPVVLEPVAAATLPATRQSGEILSAPNPAQLLSMAVQQGADLDRLERLMALQERWEAGEARKAFVTAMTAFKTEPLEIFKRKEVGYSTKDGEFVGYKHAELSDVADVVVPAMARHGLSHRWDVRQEAGRIHVRCIVTHRLGHSEAVELDAAPDDSGKKNKIQQVASAVTYLQRYTLLLATGLATKSQEDDDGRGAGDTEKDISGLLSRLYEITDSQKALQFWQKEREGLRGDNQAYGRFKVAVAEHRRGLEGGAK